MKKFFKLKNLFFVTFLAVAGFFSYAAVAINKQVEETPVVEKAEAAYNSTIRVYVDLSGFGTIDYVRIAGKEASNNAVLTSSNAKYNQSLGQYVYDLNTSSHYDKMGFYFSEYSTWWQYEYDDGWVWIDGGFDPGYEYQFKNISYKSGGGPKYFNCEKYKIGEIIDNVSNPTVYFVDGYSWHASGSVYVHYWGGTASSTYPGSVMTDTGIRLKCYVGSKEYDSIEIYKFTISGSCAYVQFNNNSSKTGDLRPVNGKVYYYGVNDTYDNITSFLVTLRENMGSYTYNGRVFNPSICKINSSTRTSLISTYNTISTTGADFEKASITGSGLYTYSQPEIDNTTMAKILIPDIISQLQKNSSRGFSSIGNFSPFNMMNSEDDSLPVVIIIVTSSVALLSITALSVLVVKKRKTKEE